MPNKNYWNKQTNKNFISINSASERIDFFSGSQLEICCMNKIVVRFYFTTLIMHIFFTWITHKYSDNTLITRILLGECILPAHNGTITLKPFCHKISAAAAAAESLQSCLTLCDPIDSSPPGSPVPGILQARTLESVAISFSCAWKWEVKVKSLSRVRLLATPWTAAHQAPPSMGFSRKEYWSGVPLPSLSTLWAGLQ